LSGNTMLTGPLGKVQVRSVAGAITAPSIRQVVTRGDFAADVTTGTLGTLKVGGALAGADLRATTSIGRVMAASIRDSRIFAGVAGAVAALPSTPADFSNAAATIGGVSVKPRGLGFSNSLIAAPTVGKLSLGSIQASNGGTPFGVAADRIASVSGIAVGGTGSIRRSRLDDPTSSVTDGDFVLRLM
jgi:hypothetical protein